MAPTVSFSLIFILTFIIITLITIILYRRVEQTVTPVAMTTYAFCSTCHQHWELAEAKTMSVCSRCKKPFKIEDNTFSYTHPRDFLRPLIEKHYGTMASYQREQLTATCMKDVHQVKQTNKCQILIHNIFIISIQPHRLILSHTILIRFIL